MIKQIIAAMTLEQKVVQLIQIPYAQVGREKAIEWTKRSARIRIWQANSVRQW